MKFDIITIFPRIFDSYFNESIIKRAQNKRLIKIKIHDLRDFALDKHRTVDDKPYGGGAGMILKIEPIYKAIKKIKITNQNSKLILLSAKGKKFEQKMAYQLSKFKRLIIICGHYEGVDERLVKYIADEEISIGDYVLTGGELPAMILVDAITRLIPGVIKKESLVEESFNIFKRSDVKGQMSKVRCQTEYPQYTRPEIFYPNPKNKKIAWRVPKILLSGNHKKIEEWRQKMTGA